MQPPAHPSSSSSSATTATAAPLCAPYERFPCNELRRECYRRKLGVIKSGPLMNATKMGFVNLLRESDMKGNPQQQAHAHAHVQVKTAPRPFSLPPASATTTPTVSRADSPPPSPMTMQQQLSLPPPRPPRMETAVLGSHSLLSGNGKRDLSGMAFGDDQMPSSPDKKPRQDQFMELPYHTDSSCSSCTSTQNSSTSSPPTEPNDGSSFHKMMIDPAAAEATLPRWERLHARLNVVNEKLRMLRGRRDPWLPALADSDENDVAFYEAMKQQLQRGLLECVADA